MDNPQIIIKPNYNELHAEKMDIANNPVEIETHMTNTSNNLLSQSLKISENLISNMDKTNLNSYLKYTNLQNNEEIVHEKDQNSLPLSANEFDYKCFKCLRQNYKTLAELKDHQKLCLLLHNTGDNYKSFNSLSSDTLRNKFKELPIILPFNNNAVQKTTQIIDKFGPMKRRIKKIFFCSVCNTFHRNWNLFLHMRKKHNCHICLYCFNVYKKVEYLTLHLEMKHDIEQNHFDCQEKLMRSSCDSCFVMCCTCEIIFNKHDRFSDHICKSYINSLMSCNFKTENNSNIHSIEKCDDTKNTQLQNKIVLNLKKSEFKFLPNNNQDITASIREIGNDYSQKTNSNYKNKSEVFEKPKDNSKCNFDHDLINLYRSNRLEISNKRQMLEKKSNKHANKDYTYMKENGFLNIQKSRPNSSKYRTSKTSVQSPLQTLEEISTNPSQQTFFDSNAQTVAKLSIVPKFKLKIPKLDTSIISSVEKSPTKPFDQNPEMKIKINRKEISKKKKSKKLVENDSEAYPRRKKLNADSDMDIDTTCANYETFSSELSKVKLQQIENEFVPYKQTSPDENENIETQNLIHTHSNAQLPADLIQTNDTEIKTLDEDNTSTYMYPTASSIYPFGIINENQIMELFLEVPLDKIDMIKFLRTCLEATFPICLYCNHARRIAVNGKNLVTHILEVHRFSATVDSITAEELSPSTITTKLSSYLDELNPYYLNMNDYCNIDRKENTIVTITKDFFECFHCRFSTSLHKELYLHNRKMHFKAAMLCIMCKSNFHNFCEILCHKCPGSHLNIIPFNIKFRCCLCDLDDIPSAFRLMVHLRKAHFACDVCLEHCYDQNKLSSHVWKHKLQHLCYRCGIAYRNKPDITKHLFWKHGTESVMCKRCLQKRWPHVYHFCTPPPHFLCDICNLSFSKAMYLRVHKRLHTGYTPYSCTEPNCENKFISRKLMLKHIEKFHTELKTEPENFIQQTPSCENSLPPEITVNEDIGNVNQPSSVQNCIKSSSLENESNEGHESTTTSNKHSNEKVTKKRKLKCENLEDLNLQAPNLSESDSNDECEKNVSGRSDKSIALSPKRSESESKIDTIGRKRKIDEKMSFRESSSGLKSFVDIEQSTTMLHVAQSDHDYCHMFKSMLLNEESKSSALKSKSESEKCSKNTHSLSDSPKKIRNKNESDCKANLSSSISSTSLDLSSNCSCSSSNDSSSDSSSSYDSSCEGEGEGEGEPEAEPAAEPQNSTQIPQNIVPENLLEPVILECDLETEESETDEEFYDDHPQKQAKDIFDRQRDLLIKKVILHPTNKYNKNRSSTPSLNPPVINSEVELKKKNEKPAHKNFIPPFKLNISKYKLNSSSVQKLKIKKYLNDSENSIVSRDSLNPAREDLINTISEGVPPKPFSWQPLDFQESEIKYDPNNIDKMTSVNSPKFFKNGSSSDGLLKRSKRFRKPNRFYGYSSDEEKPHKDKSIRFNPFKPTSPPLLRWCKEDLPSPSKSIHSQKNFRLHKKAIKMRKLNLDTTSKYKNFKEKIKAYPPIPTLKIRPPPSTAISNSYSSIINKMPAPSDFVMDVQSVQDKKIHSPIISEFPHNKFGRPETIDETLKYSTTLSEINKSIEGKENTISSKTKTLGENYQQQHSIPVSSSLNQQPPNQLRTTNIPPALIRSPDASIIQYLKRNNIRYPIRPPEGARSAREGESVYCYCRCPYDEVSEMIACDGNDCMIEWFHFECVGILVPPVGLWYCAECKIKQEANLEKSKIECRNE